MSEEKLKPCPFCGGEAYIQSAFYDYMHYWCICEVCKAGAYAKSPDDDTAEGAIKAWNTRISNTEIENLQSQLQNIVNEYNDIGAGYYWYDETVNKYVWKE